MGSDVGLGGERGLEMASSFWHFGIHNPDLLVIDPYPEEDLNPLQDLDPFIKVSKINNFVDYDLSFRSF